MERCRSLPAGRQESRGKSGQAATEFALMLPIAAAVIIAVFAVALTGVRGIVAQLAAVRAARVAAVFQDDLVANELYASLDPSIFRSHSFDIKAEAGGMRASNEIEAVLELNASSTAALANSAASSWFKRLAPLTPALPEDLRDTQLRGGDTPSPYCRAQGGYEACGWPE